MPKINTISKDTILDIYDMILGSNEVGVTKNFSLAQLTAFLSGYDGFGLVIVESQLDFTTAEPTIVSGLKYLNTTTGDSNTTTTEVIADYIYEATDDSWTPTPPSEGYVIWNRDTKSFLVYNGTAWVSFGGTLTDAEVKTKYENNADTNAFTDAEKTLLANQSGTNTGDQDLSSYATKGVRVDMGAGNNIDWSAGTEFEKILTENVTITESNLPTGTETETILFYLTLAGFSAVIPTNWNLLNDDLDLTGRNCFVVNCLNGTPGSEDIIAQNNLDLV